MPDLIVHARPGQPGARAVWKGEEFPCLVGRNGPIDADRKREGDGCTPLGRWALGQGFYRSDRIGKPVGGLDWRAIAEGDCWCDDAADPRYNMFIPGDDPEAPRHGQGGTLWKAGHEYDAIVFLHYNANPAMPGKGSAILLHGWREGATSSGGCVVLPNDVLRRLAGEFVQGDGVEVRLA